MREQQQEYLAPRSPPESFDDGAEKDGRRPQESSNVAGDGRNDGQTSAGATRSSRYQDPRKSGSTSAEGVDATPGQPRVYAERGGAFEDISDGEFVGRG